MDIVRSRILPAALLVLFASSASAQQTDTLTYELPEVRVEVSRLAVGGTALARVPFGAQVIHSPALVARHPLTAADALAALPGISMSDELGSSAQPALVLRGFAVSPIVGMPQGVSVFVDGVRVNEPGASHVNFDLIPLQAIERIEVIRGPAAAFGKNTLGGAVNVVTRRAVGNEARLDASLGSFGQRVFMASLMGRRGSVDFLAAGRYHYSRGWRDAASVRIGNLFGRVGRRGEQSDISVSYTFSDNRILQAGSLPASWLADPNTIPPQFIPEVGSDPRTINFTGGDLFRPRMHFATGHYTLRLNAHMALETNAFFRRTDVDQFNANFTEPDTRIVTEASSAGTALQLSYTRERLLLTAGTEYSVNDLSIGILEHPNQNFPELPEAGRLAEDVGTTEHNMGIYTQARYESSDLAAVTGALRFDYVTLPFSDRLEPENSGDNLFRQVTGSIGVDFFLDPAAVVFASYGRGFRAPALLEIACASPEDPCPLPYELGADPPLDPVIADTWQAGIRYFGVVDLEAIGFWSEVYDDIFTVQPPGTRVGYFDNLARTRRQGLELSTEVRPVKTLLLQAGLGLTRATFQTEARLAAGIERDEEEEHDPDLEPPTVRPGDSFPMIPGLRVHTAVTYEFGRWRAGMELQYTGKQWLRGDEDNSERALRLEPYLLLDALLHRDFGPVTLFARAENLLNSRYQRFGVLALNLLGGEEAARVEPFLTPGIPRLLTVGLRVRLADS